ncbi:glycine/sarcosine/betaine reductase component B subunit [Desulfovibrio sp. OttesenSCG-928-G15]|nr:glycine/sarcosine/betaine reductase component B subunit [Desulfovibrio sp. OttesenSCG-928-G15]
MGTSPSTKETTLHHCRDPLAARLRQDPDVDFTGVIINATSDVYVEKMLVAKRTACMLDAMRPDGYLISLGAWGNPHIDFAGVAGFAGQLGIPCVALSFLGSIGSFVVDTPHMLAHLDLNKTSHGAESLAVGDNTVVEQDALKALTILKSRLRKRQPERRVAFDPGTGLVRQMRRLEVRTHAVQEVRRAEQTALEAGVLHLDLAALERRVFAWPGSGWEPGPLLQGLIRRVTISILPPAADCGASGHDVQVNSILDFVPLAAKAEGLVGEGVTNRLSGVQMMLCAVDEDGYQPINFGCAKGRLGDVVQYGRSGTPAPDEYIIHVDVLLKSGEGCTREGVMAAHLAGDIILEEIRELLRPLNRYQAMSRQKFIESTKPGLLRIALVKMLSGDGAMGDAALFPQEPGGFIGSRSIMDLTHNLPILISPNEYQDGIIRNLS